MPRIPDDMLESVFYLYPSRQAAELGERVGGSGFFVLVPFEGAETNHLYMVTNKHVIDNGNLTGRVNVEVDKSVAFDTDDRNWFVHPAGDDLAILLVDVTEGFTCKGLNFNETGFVTQQVLQQFDLGIGDDVFTVGRFVNHDGKQRNNPVVRFGNIAQMPVEPIKQNGRHLQESYLVECKSVAGYSGSPVFAYIPPFAIRPGIREVSSKSYGPWLLGISWGHLNEWKPVCDAGGDPVGTYQVGVNSGMMGVVPVWKLTEMLNHPTVIEKRKERENSLLGGKPQTTAS
jgi:hypothetical protein